MLISSSIQDQVKNIVGKFKDKNSNIEIEFKFGSSVDGKFKSSVSSRTFYRLIKDLKNMKIYGKLEESTDEIYEDNIRKVTSSFGVKWMKKERLYDYTSDDYQFKLSVSKETVLSSYQPKSRSNYIRRKKRRSYILKDISTRIDLTQVNDSNFEIEFELLSLETNLDDVASKAFKLVNNTFDTYTVGERRNILKYINSTLESPTGGDLFFDLNNLALPRNLKFKDIVYGGLVGHPDVTYNITHKTDGIRKLLLVHDTGVWLVSMNNELTKISKDSLFKYFDNENNLFGMCGYILDGELVPKDRRIEGKGSGSEYWFLVFDCLAVPNNSDRRSFKSLGVRGVQDEPFITRMENAQLAADELKNPIIEVSTKNFISLTTPFDFFDVVGKMVEEQKNLPYYQDGFMFTPIEIGYRQIIKSSKQSVSQRTLTLNPEIVKWKDKTNLTIDFEISWRGKKLTLLTRRDNEKVEFKGDWINRFDESMIHMTDLLSSTTSGMIGEFAYDYDRNKLVLRDIRNDKIRPNGESVVLDVWRDIFDPIDVEVLTGNSMKLLRMYHNRIKTSLYNFVGRENEGKTLLDIGSGRGGDVSKWRNFSKVVAVEPNIENYKELVNRINTFNMSDRVFAINAKGEDTKKVTDAVRKFIGTRVDVVSMMLSLSYFFESKQVLKKLLDTIQSNIAQNGKFTFLTIDGNIVQNFFEPQLSNSISLKEIRSGDYFLMKYNSDTVPISVDVYIKESILNNREWLVSIDDLILFFSQYGYKLTNIYRADKEKLLSQDEKIFSSMFSYGVFEPSGEVRESIVKGTKTKTRNYPVEITLTKKVTLPDIPKVNIVTIEDNLDVTPFKINDTKRDENINLEPATKQLVQNMVKVNRVEVDGMIEYLPAQKLIGDVTADIIDNIFRISSMDDNDSLFDCIMTGTTDKHRDSSIETRKDTVRSTRKDIAQILGEKVEGTDQTYFEYILFGLYPVAGFTLEEMQNNIGNEVYLGEEYWFAISEIMEIDLMICEVYESKTSAYIKYVTSTLLSDRPILILHLNDFHFELIGQGNKIKFYKDDDIVKKLIKEKYIK